MIRTQVSLAEEDYRAAKKEARSLGISLAELFRRAVRAALRPPSVTSQNPWMRYAGMVETGDCNSSQNIDAVIYGQKD